MKLLVEMDNRIARIVKELRVGGAGFPISNELLSRLADMRADLRRLHGKIDTLSMGDVESLERGITRISELSDQTMRTTIARVSPGDALRVTETLRALSEGSVLANYTGGLRIGLIQIEPDEFIERVPGQKLAAFQFGFEDNTLVVVDQPILAAEREHGIAEAALEAAIEQGDYVVADLQTSNASPRLKDAYSRLQMMMSSHKNIVQIGARAQICSRIVQAEVDELSPALFGLLLGHVETVFAALSQFSDWREYCENASTVTLDRNAIDDLTRVTAQIIADIRQSGVTHPNVVDALETATDWVAQPATVDKRDVFSLTRTLENLWSIVVKATLSVGGETLSETRKLAAKTVLISLLVVGAGAVPIISKVPGGEWVQTVYNYLQSMGFKPGAN
ncbi:hypothetical protein [Shinella fusca]|uniref:Uncharacterized protein n=1 Tax=Shinella fusca TaxID=544480 RepID=A0A7W7YT45_9HYPH|nr:hypothetical protein [Shinella fusca]MBB5041904.1 hypothetical protein [Shinella fusca]